MKRILILAPILVLISLLSICAPGLACQVKDERGNYACHSIAFTAVQVPIGNDPGPNYISTVTDDNIQIVRDLLGHGSISLWLSPIMPSSTPSLQGTTNSVIDTTTNLNTGKGCITFQMTWTFASGTFEGIIVGKLVGPTGVQPPTSYSQTLWGVLQGTGAYKGQTAIFTGFKPAGQPFTWTGTIFTQ